MEGEERLKEFIREREKRKTILIRQQITPIQYMSRTEHPA
jgi:hypothetical protein